MSPTSLRILHVVATGDPRGAERFASALVHVLMEEQVEQSIAILRAPAGCRLEFAADVEILERGSRGGERHLDLARVRALRDLIGRQVPTIIQAHGGEALKYALLAEAANGSRTVYRRIGDATALRGSALREMVNASLIRRAAAVIAVADALRDELVRRFRVDPRRVFAIPNAVDPNTLGVSRLPAASRRQLGIPLEVPVVLSLGALTWEKDPLAALRIGLDAGISTGAVHLFAGSGPLEGSLERAAHEARAGDRVRLLGSRSDVGDLLSVSDVLLLASRSEGMPGCVIEAGIAGVPVAAFGLSGVPEVIENGVTGRLVAPGDEPTLSTTLRWMLEDSGERRRLGDAARTRCLERFTIDRVTARYLEVYERVAARTIAA